MRVEWKSSALDRLADWYVLATLPEREEIERTVLRMNAMLAADPWLLGESRESDSVRVWFEYPLAVAFRIVPEADLVIVRHVAQLKPRTDE